MFCVRPSNLVCTRPAAQPIASTSRTVVLLDAADALHHRLRCRALQTVSGPDSAISTMGALSSHQFLLVCVHLRRPGG